jgi:hypothetical protein
MKQNFVQERLMELLGEITSKLGVTGSAVVSRNGVVIVSKMPQNTDTGRLQAISAVILGVSEDMNRDFGHGSFQHTILSGEKGDIVIVGAGPAALLITAVQRDVDINSALMEIERVADRIKEILHNEPK